MQNDEEKKFKGEEKENLKQLKQLKSPTFLHTLMYWPEHTFLLNDFGKALKKHIKGLCSAWAQLLLCFLPFSPVSFLNSETANLVGFMGKSSNAKKLWQYVNGQNNKTQQEKDEQQHC